jgi:hypothetical protein
MDSQDPTPVCVNSDREHTTIHIGDLEACKVTSGKTGFSE